jgi:hypothetical protein
MIVRLIALLLASVLVLPVLAQQGQGDPLSQADVERIRVEKKAWMALNMDLKPEEAQSFWPVYEGYQKDLGQINLRLVRLVESYGNHYRNNTLTDEIARKLTEEALAVDEAELKLRRTYFNRLAKALSVRKAARYLQLEGRVHTQVRYELAANLPLVGDVRPDIPAGAR